jgi:hypothetical protein
MNPHQDAIRLIEKNLDKLDDDAWVDLCENYNAVHIIAKNLDKADCEHSNEFAHYGNCGWTALTLNKNPDAIPLLEKGHVNLWYIAENRNIFVDEYHVACKEYFVKCVTEELFKKMFNPNNIQKFESWGFTEKIEGDIDI